MSDFINNPVNKRFREVYKALDSNNLIKGKSDIARELGTYNHVINSILKGKRNITVDQLNKLFDTYNVNANYIFGGIEPMFANDSDISVQGLENLRAGGRKNITLIPQKALAGYALEGNNPDYFDQLQKFSIPNMEGELIAIEISGDSMMPTITSGDMVICERLERNTPLKDNAVYVIVTDVVVAKRIQQIKRGNQTVGLRLISDNNIYHPYDVELVDVSQILKVKCRLTAYGVN
ncbi:MAG: phage repressor protein C with HTH and peptisase S24 domain [Cognaticolwellia sp.]|jgi:phage repressor protein C with HTH and peptisase S24 domain